MSKRTCIDVLDSAKTIVCSLSRVGPIGQLKVWPVKGSEGRAKEVTGRSQSGFSLINFNRNTSVYIAGVGDAHRVWMHSDNCSLIDLFINNYHACSWLFLCLFH